MTKTHTLQHTLQYTLKYTQIYTHIHSITFICAFSRELLTNHQPLLGMLSLSLSVFLENPPYPTSWRASLMLRISHQNDFHPHFYNMQSFQYLRVEFIIGPYSRLFSRSDSNRSPDDNLPCCSVTFVSRSFYYLFFNFGFISGCKMSPSGQNEGALIWSFYVQWLRSVELFRILNSSVSAVCLTRVKHSSVYECIPKIPAFHHVSLWFSFTEEPNHKS